MSLAAAIKEETGAETVLQVGTPGQFDVLADGKLIFSKHASGRFPDEKEVLDALPD